MKTNRMRWSMAGLLLAATAVAAAVADRGAVSAGGAGAELGSGRNGPVSLQGRLDRAAVLRDGDGLVKMELVVSADEVAPVDRRGRATDLVVVLDRSGSMSGEKMQHAKASIRELLTHLRPQDRIGLVSYAGDSRVEIPLTAFSGENRGAVERSVASVYTGGGTNMSSGLDLGFSMIEGKRRGDRVPHLILISDGLANEGDSSRTGLVGRAGRAAIGEFMLSTVGVGIDFNESLMSAIADAGTGNYYFVEHAEHLGDVFAREFDAARTTVATGLELRLEPGPGVTVLDVSGYPLHREDDFVMVRPGSLYSGQERRLWATLRIPNRELGDYEIGSVALSYSVDQERRSVRLDERPTVACVGSEDDYFAEIDVDTWGRSVVVDEYNAVQKRVADSVKKGQRSEALGLLDGFRSRVRGLNAKLGSDEVSHRLVVLDELEEEVEQAFEGAPAARLQKQKEFSKQKGASARDDRRVGAKKEQQR